MQALISSQWVTMPLQASCGASNSLTGISVWVRAATKLRALAFRILCRVDAWQKSRFSKPSVIPNRQYINILKVVIFSEVVIFVILLAAITATSVEKARWLPEFEMQKQCNRHEAGNTNSNSPAAETRFQNVSRLRDRS